MNALGSILQHFKLVYIIADTGAMSTDVAARCRSYLLQLSGDLAKRGAQTVLKIIVSSNGSTRENVQQPPEVVILDVGKTTGPMSNRKLKRHKLKAGKILTPSCH